MKTVARTLIFLTLIYLISFPLYLGYSKARTIIFPQIFRSLVIEISKKHNLDPLLIAAIIYTESSFKPGAVSRTGAMGLMQIMPDTARLISKKLGIKNFILSQTYDPKINLEMGCFFLNQLMEEFGDYQKALIAYNAGRGNLMKWLNEGDPLSRAFPETRRYVIKIERLHKILRIVNSIHRF